MYKVGMHGMGAEDFGPPVPTITQQATQTVTDISNKVESMTGLKNFAYYLGVGLVGWVAYQYMTGDGK